MRRGLLFTLTALQLDAKISASVKKANYAQAKQGEIKMEESTKKNLHPKLLLLTASVILVCIVALVAQIPKKKPEPQIDVTTTLEKIVKTSDLSTAVFQYQGIVEIPNQKNLKKIDYYICYTASVYAGIDFSEVTKPTISLCWTPHLRRVKPISGRNAPAKVLCSASHK